jgi:hypothetical protein
VRIAHKFDWRKNGASSVKSATITTWVQSLLKEVSEVAGYQTAAAFATQVNQYSDHPSPA